MLNRDLQERLLKHLQGCYPHKGFSQQIATSLECDHGALCFNASYLLEHELLAGRVRYTSDGNAIAMTSQLAITAKGLDFLEDDGGLTAILGTQIVRIDANSIRDIILNQIDSADIPENEKSGIRKGLAGLTKTGLEEAVRQLVQKGLAHSPDAIPYLQTLFQNVLM